MDDEEPRYRAHHRANSEPLGPLETFARMPYVKPWEGSITHCSQSHERARNLTSATTVTGVSSETIWPEPHHPITYLHTVSDRPAQNNSDQTYYSSSRAVMEALSKKAKKKKVLLMGKSGAGKSSMRSIIFSNYVAKDVRRLGATIDVEHSNIKFLGNLVLNLWDCGGQDAFTETYLTNQRSHIFSSVGVLIYVFDVESRSFENSSPGDLTTYSAVISALAEHSPQANVFCLVHKMDLVQNDYRENVIANRAAAINECSDIFKGKVKTYGTSIWDQSLYGAWGSIVHALIPDLDVIEGYLKDLSKECNAEEVVLFERSTFLTVMSVVGEVGERNPYPDRQERLSNILKTFKHSVSKFTESESANPFHEFVLKAPRFNLIIHRLTNNTYVLVVLPPGECDLECARFNIKVARADFASQETGGRQSPGR
ncbi:GTP-binding protein gtr1 [Lecanora helva]